MKRKSKYLLIPIVVILSLTILYFGSELLAIVRLGLTKVPIAKLSLPARTCINDDYIDYIYVPKAYVNDNCYATSEDLLDKFVKLNAYIPKGSLFYKDFLEDRQDMKDNVHYLLNDNEVTYDLFVKDIKVNPAHLTKGMHIDIYLTIKQKEVCSDLLISGARIIGLYDVNNKEIKNNPIENYSLGTISIALKQEMVSYLNKAITIGDVSIIVSNGIYDKKDMYLNKNSKIFDYLSW